ncbi:MAG: acyl-CoA/acyl-ACP dehydrogenase [Anaerolineales bacterium]|nr:acyl-CoA/acyl-ACP dehydrogenase [Anaerolineales bacterium]
MPLIEIAKKLAQEFASRADEADKAGKLPLADIAALKLSGYLAASVPRDFGGVGATLRQCMEAQIELAQGSASTAMVAAMQLHIFGHARETCPWPESIFAEFCARAVRGEIFNSVASEPLLGSPSRGGLPETYAEATPDGWCLHGHKTWATGGRYLDHLLVRARLENEPTVFWVEQGTAGVEWTETWQHALSLRASESHDVYFRGVSLRPEKLIARGRDSAKNAWFPMLITATYLGAAYAARNALIVYARERVPTALGKPIATLPAIQRQIGEIEIALQAARALLLEAASVWDEAKNGEAAYARIVAAKHFATEAANTVTDKALKVAGGASITAALSLERHFRDVRAGPMHPPSGDTALELVGRAVLE